MKSIFICIIIATFALTSAQTKMYINKTSGGTDSIALSEIKGISFKTSTTDRQILFQENFENGNLNNWLLFSTPEISTLHSVSGTHSLTLPSNRGDYCFIYKNLTDSIKTGIVGLEYKVMKKDSSAKSPFYGLLYQKYLTIDFNAYLAGGFRGGGNLNDFADSIFISIWDRKTPNIHIFSKIVEKIQTSKWYKFNLEYDFINQTVTFYLNDLKVGEHVYAFTFFDSIMFGDHDSDGIDNGNAYFLDDIVLYKR